MFTIAIPMECFPTAYFPEVCLVTQIISMVSPIREASLKRCACMRHVLNTLAGDPGAVSDYTYRAGMGNILKVADIKEC